MRIDWVEIVSHAHERPVCMYAGLIDKDHPRVGHTGWIIDDRCSRPDWHDEDPADTNSYPRYQVGVEEYLRLIQRERIRAKRSITSYVITASFLEG